MLCKNIKEEIFEAVLSGAAPGENAKAHILGCAACEKEYQSMRSTMNLLDTWETPEPSPYFDVRLRARLREAKNEAQEKHGVVAQWLEKIGLRQLTWKPVAAGAFALIMAVGGGLYMGNPAGIVNHGTTVQAACPVVDLQALDKNQQVLNALQDLDDDSSNNSQTDVSE
jgi:hypothetical protein